MNVNPVRHERLDARLDRLNQASFLGSPQETDRTYAGNGQSFGHPTRSGVVQEKR